MTIRDNYTPRRLSALGQGYSAFVKILKFALPVAALVIVGILISRLSGETTIPQKIAEIPKEEKTTPGQLELVAAKYEGVDEEGHPYTVSADRATRAMNAPDSVLFENPLADITLKDGTWVAAKSKSGTFDRTTEQLVLTDGVSVFHDSGYEMNLQDIHIDLKQRTASTALSVRAQGPMGTISAQNMRVEEQGNIVVFGGPATLTLFKLKGRG